VKIAVDKVVSAALIVASAPVSVLIVMAIALESLISPRTRAGLFHTETRVSAGEPFELYKFRILTPGGEAKIEAGDRPKAVENDPRNLTRVGAVLKKYGVDELPQLFQVLNGTMSLVGPRPKPFREYPEALRRGETYRSRLRAGLTGPTQVLKGTDPATRRPDADEFAYLALIERGSQWSILRADVGILRRTVKVLVSGAGE
jgi:lipopolysaccharide/colanic/teichoic acid biosynthesis glycosyltransferase